MNDASTLRRLCASANVLCTGLAPCDECHRVRTAVLAHALALAGYTERRRVLMFLQNYGTAMDTVRRQVGEQLAQQPTLNGAAAPPPDPRGGIPLAPDTDPQLEGMTPAELRILRSRFGGDEAMMRRIDAVIMRKEAALEAEARAREAAETPEPQPEDDLMRPLSPGELSDLMRRAQEPAEAEVLDMGRPVPMSDATFRALAGHGEGVTETKGPTTEEGGSAVAVAPVPTPSPEPKGRARLPLREPRRRRPARSDTDTSASAGEGEPEAAVVKETIKETTR